MDITQSLAEIGASASTSSRPAAYLALLKQLLSQPSSSISASELRQKLSEYLDEAVINDINSQGGGLVVGRQVLTDFSQAIADVVKGPIDGTDGDQIMKGQGEELAIMSEDVRRKVLEDALEKIQPRVLSFEEQSSAMRLHLADLLENDEDWLEAAKVLQGIPLGSGHRTVPNIYKLRIYIRIVRLLLEGDDAVGADTFLKRASMVIHSVPGATSRGGPANEEDEERLGKMSEEEKVEARTMGLQYKLCQARIYDAQRRFAEAAIRFHEVSYVAEIDEDERNLMLSSAVTASILAPAGPLRSRILATLIRDERTASLPQYTILTKVFLDQIIRPYEIAAFEKLLGPHQRAALPKTSNKALLPTRDEDSTMQSTEDDEESTRYEPSTVLDRAMMEHNILATSRLYSNITFRGLGGLLDLSSLGAETMVRRMVVQKRLKAEIDQVEGLVIFGEETEREAGVAGRGAKMEGGGAGGEVNEEQDQMQDDPSATFTKRWDASIARTSSAVEELCAKLRSRGLVSVVQQL